jgi:hypothetical protein
MSAVDEVLLDELALRLDSAIVVRLVRFLTNGSALPSEARAGKFGCRQGAGARSGRWNEQVLAAIAAKTILLHGIRQIGELGFCLVLELLA